jgi:hypothetical protein
MFFSHIALISPAWICRMLVFRVLDAAIGEVGCSRLGALIEFPTRSSIDRGTPLSALPIRILESVIELQLQLHH